MEIAQIREILNRHEPHGIHMPLLAVLDILETHERQISVLLDAAELQDQRNARLRQEINKLKGIHGA